MTITKYGTVTITEDGFEHEGFEFDEEGDLNILVKEWAIARLLGGRSATVHGVPIDFTGWIDENRRRRCLIDQCANC